MKAGPQCQIRADIDAVLPCGAGTAPGGAADARANVVLKSRVVGRNGQWLAVTDSGWP